MTTDHRAQVLQATDIIQLISQTVALKRSGRSFVGLCPFHQEKTPSFHVDPSKQTFYCFGCKAGGTAFDFVMKRDRVEFREALEILAQQAGIDLPKFGGKGQAKPGERQLLIDAHSAACQFYQDCLNQPAGAAAREYLAKRGYIPETIKRFQLGLAPDAWDGLLKSPVGRKFGPATLATAGLAKPRQQGDGFYDTFRNRIIYPIRNEGGQIIAFGGRVMPGSDDPAKYLNSPETPLFNKSRAIYGIDVARQKIVETRAAIVVEGYNDTVVAHQFGATNVVSPLGTALTETHVGVLRRFADRIILLFDADAAGDAAVDRVVGLFLTQPIEIAVASIPDGMDPDEFLLKYGLEAFNELIAKATDALAYAWKQSRRKFVSNEGDLTGQQKAVTEYLGLLAGARGTGPVDTLRWGAAIRAVGKLTGIPDEDLHRRFKAKRPVVRARPAESPPAGEQLPEQSPDSESADRPDLIERAQRQVLGVLLLEPRRWMNVQQQLGVEDFTSDALRRLAESYWDYQRDEGEAVFNQLLATLTDEGLRSLAMEIVREVEDLADLDVTLTKAIQCMADIRRRSEERQRMNEARSGCLTDEQQIELLRRTQEGWKPDLRRRPSSA